MSSINFTGLKKSRQKPQNRCISKIGYLSFNFVCIQLQFLRAVTNQNPTIINGTLDGQNPAPVDKQRIPLFTRIYTSQWCRISSTNTMKTKMHSSKQVGQRCHSPRICAKGRNPVAVTVHHG